MTSRLAAGIRARSARWLGEGEGTRRASDGKGEVGPAVRGAGSLHVAPILSAPGGGEREKAQWRVSAVAGIFLAAIATAAYFTLPPPSFDRGRDASVLVLASDGSVLRGFLSADAKWRLPIEPQRAHPPPPPIPVPPPHQPSPRPPPPAPP